MFEQGTGVPQNYVRAHMWFNLSAARGNTTAIGPRNTVASRMTAAQIAEAQKLAADWKPTSTQR
jgi:TPR repeat protein